MKKTNHIIKAVLDGSIAMELGIEPGDKLLKINNMEITDVFDYRYFINDEFIEVVIQKQNGEEWELEIEKDYHEDLGVEFESGLMDEYRSCRNQCMFCFIDQMPPGMRETLYFKDDDSRLSFLQGNYITLTNMTDKDIERIVQYHLEPINISVHTMNPNLRCKMLNNRFAGEALNKLDILYAGNIKMNGQIVLCKGINDGAQLSYTIEQLCRYLPCMESVSVVPAGITKYREGLPQLDLFNASEAEEVIDLIERWQVKIYNEKGLHFIHASDEWYIMAKRPFPESDRYDGYSQLENGVGMMRLLNDEFNEAYETLIGDNRSLDISIATGVLAYEQIVTMAGRIMAKFPNIKIRVYQIINYFFGETITVSGLLTGQDITAQLKDKKLGEKLLLPANILRSREAVFLDDISLKELETALHVSVNIVESNGKAFIESILNATYNKPKDNENYVYIKAYE